MRNVLSRFAGSSPSGTCYGSPYGCCDDWGDDLSCLPPPVFVGLDTLPAGFVQPIEGNSEPSPIGSFPLYAGRFDQDMRLPAAVIGAGLRAEYIPTWTPSGTVGGGLFGPGPIGYRVAYHPLLIPVTVTTPGGTFTVYEPLCALSPLVDAHGAPLLDAFGQPLVYYPGAAA